MQYPNQVYYAATINSLCSLHIKTPERERRIVKYIDSRYNLITVLKKQ